MNTILGAVTALVWAGLLSLRGRFWCSGPVIEPIDPKSAGAASREGMPKVAVVIPARNEAEHIEQSLRSLLAQDYSGGLHVVLVDDNSSDDTDVRARALAHVDGRLSIVSGSVLPEGWSGKMWAVAQGLNETEAMEADFVLLTDADIVHGAHHVRQLVGKATRSAAQSVDLVSEMVNLRTESVAERALIPAFVFFFQMLYPFDWVNDAARPEAAAAGGTMLVSRAALERIGGVARIRGALIDDVALAREIKRGGHAVWLGHATNAVSLRSYPEFGDVFRMVARTAYVQLEHSPLLLCGTVAGMALMYLCPMILTLFARGNSRYLGAASWIMPALAFQPTLKRYRQSPLWGFALPAIALFYMGATVGSAVLHYSGKGGRWKGRVYPARVLSE